MNINVSVIIPSYNREATIERCIKSILNQTIQPYEIIVVDDGSNDKTVEILNNIQCDFLKIIKQNHRGAQAARNLGITNAKGNYIAFLDSDDEWCSNSLERELECIKSGNEDCVIYADCYVSKGRRKKLWSLPGKGGNMYQFLLQYPGPMFQSMILKKDNLLQIGLLDENVPAYQEWETAIRLSKKYKFVHINEPLFIYYQHEGETISKNLKKNIVGYSYVIKKHRKEIVKNNGWQALEKHYEILAEQSIQCKSYLFFKFFFQQMIIKCFPCCKK